jgi:DNA-binding beta-propeller fold protein YncE
MRRLLAALVCVAALVLPAGASAFGPLGSIGSYGDGAGQMRSPQGMDFAADGTMYVADSGNDRISVFSASGAFLRAFGDGVGPGGADVCTISCQASDGEAGLAGQTYRPIDLAVSGDRVYVADRSQTRVEVFSTAGAFLFAFGKDVGPAGADICTTTCFPGAGTDEAAGAVFPAGIAIDGGQVFLANEEYDRVDVFSTEGGFLYSFGKKVNLTDNSDVCTAASGCREGEENGAEALGQPLDLAFGADGRLHIVDGQNERIDVWTRQGAFLSTFASGQLIAPVSISTSPATIYVADTGPDVVETFSYAGLDLGEFAATPSLAAVASPCGGNVYVSEQDNGDSFARITRFGEPGTLLPPCPPAESPPVVPISTVAPSNQFKFLRLVLNRQKGTATLTVNVPGPGKLMLAGATVKKLTKMAKRAGNVKLAVKAKGKALKKLNETGKATLKAKLTFTPTGGAALTKPRSLTLKKKLG